MNRTLITPAAVEPVTLTEAIDWMRIDGTVEDALIDPLIPAARRWAEGYARRALITQTWDMMLDRFPARDILVPLPPLQSVTSIDYIDTAGASQLLAASEYQTDIVSEPGRIAPSVDAVTWPATQIGALNAVTIRFTAGYGIAAQSVPEPIRQGMLMLIAHMFERRESTIVGAQATRVPMSAEWLLDPYRMLRFG